MGISVIYAGCVEMGVVKLKDIADKAGVSVVTASDALSGKKGVSGAVRNEIMTAAKELGYILIKGRRYGTLTVR